MHHLRESVYKGNARLLSSTHVQLTLCTIEADVQGWESLGEAIEGQRELRRNLSQEGALIRQLSISCMGVSHPLIR